MWRLEVYFTSNLVLSMDYSYFLVHDVAIKIYNWPDVNPRAERNLYLADRKEGPASSALLASCTQSRREPCRCWDPLVRPADQGAHDRAIGFAEGACEHCSRSSAEREVQLTLAFFR